MRLVAEPKGRLIAVATLSFLILSSLLLPANMFAADPTPSPGPTGVPVQPPDDPGFPVTPEGATSQQLLNSAPSCGTAGPGAVPIPADANLAAAVVYAEAAALSHFRLEASTSARPGSIRVPRSR